MGATLREHHQPEMMAEAGWGRGWVGPFSEDIVLRTRLTVALFHSPGLCALSFTFHPCPPHPAGRVGRHQGAVTPGVT